jgi:hypothetical protein
MSALSFAQSFPIKDKAPVFELNERTLLTESASVDILLGKIPDLYSFCVKLLDTFLHSNLPYSVLQFVPILKEMRPLSDVELKRLVEHTESKHILINNDLLKVVLVVWKPEDNSENYGHLKERCVFRVLNGSVEEQRYASSKKQKLLAKSTYHSDSLAYLDKSLGYHLVLSPLQHPTVSIHVYTPGNQYQARRK